MLPCSFSAREEQIKIDAAANQEKESDLEKRESALAADRKELNDAVEKYNSYLTYAGYAIGVFCVAYILWNAFKTKKTTK